MGQILLEPTHIYVHLKSVFPACLIGLVEVMSHTTGGGFTDNIPRALLPKGLGCHADVWELPRVFRWIMEAGNVEPKQMARTLVLVVAEDKVAAVKESPVAASKLAVYEIGRVTDAPGGRASWA